MHTITLTLLFTFCLAQIGWAQSIPLQTISAIKNATVFIKVPVNGGTATGSGWVMKVADDSAYIVTNHHVVVDAPQPSESDYPVVTVVFQSGTKKEFVVEANVLASQRAPDLAVLQVSGVKDLPLPIEMSSENELVETQPVTVFGFPFTGLDHDKNPPITVTKGSISSVRDDGVVQLDTNLNPGNSGGPVVDVNGKLVGIVFARPESSTDGKNLITGIGLAIQSTELEKMLLGSISEVSIGEKIVKDGEADVSVAIRLTDPLGQIKTVTLVHQTVDSGQLKESSDTEPSKLEWNVEKQRAVGSIHFKVNKPGLVMHSCRALIIDSAGAQISTDTQIFPVNFPTRNNEAKELLAYRLDTGYPYALAFSPDGKKLSVAAGEYGGQTWDLENGWNVAKYELDNQALASKSLAYSPDGKTIAFNFFADQNRVAKDEIIHSIGQWELATGKRSTFLKDKENQLFPLSFSPDGRLLAAGGSNDNVMVWDVPSGKEIDGFRSAPDNTYRHPMESISFSPNGRAFASISREGSLRIWDVATRRQIKEVRNAEGFNTLAWSTDSKQLAAGSHDLTVVLFDADGGFKRGVEMKLERRSATGLSFNSDGTLLACSADTVTLWHVSTGKRVTEINVEGGSTHYFSCVAFSPDDRFIAAGHYLPDDTFVWNLQYAIEQR